MTYPKKTIYLAGPITGLTHDEARYGWRQEFVHLLKNAGLDHIFCSSPMRGKEFLSTYGVLGSDQNQFSDNVLSTAAGITTRDYNDVKTCDAMVACFLESEGRLSGGTFMEYGFAHAHQKPIVVVGSLDDPNVYHLMAERVAGYRVGTLEDALVVVGHLLTPGI
jgi:nucleoside 2-deoxyribosyltransferase